MIDIKFEIYRHDYDRTYENKSFQNLQAFKDWMFESMNRPYVDEDGHKNMYFLDDAIRVGRDIRTGDEIRFKPEFRGAHYWVHCVSDNNKVVFSNGKYTNGKCYISEGFKTFMRDCQDLRDGKVQTFEFGEIDGYTKDSAAGGAMTHKEENIVNIALMASSLIKDGKIYIEEHGGHAALTSEIVWMAGEFERRYAEVDWNQNVGLTYWEAIDRFAEEGLLEVYGVPSKEVDELIVEATERSVEVGGSGKVKENCVKE